MRWLWWFYALFGLIEVRAYIRALGGYQLTVRMGGRDYQFFSNYGIWFWSEIGTGYSAGFLLDRRLSNLWEQLSSGVLEIELELDD
ncbi:MAG: hypothetical protein GTO40_31280 [Deltaproteobacteria bacterium]|nr:hypothetical protein [Deltaproteobacteria bacterium]